MFVLFGWNDLKLNCLHSNGCKFVLQDEEGRTGPFIDKIREQEKLEQALYIKDIENSLGFLR